ncbi:MAG: hypothetical protein WA610_05355 [Thermodesulfovibrionales bacterium]
MKKTVVSGRLLAMTLAILCLIILVGCAKKEAIKQMSDEEALRERVQLYWSHVIKEAFDKSYELEHPLYKKNVSMVEYIRGVNNNVKWIRVDIKSVVLENDTADVMLEMDTKLSTIPIYKNKTSDALMPNQRKTEKWVRVDGIWYHVPKKLRAGK